MSSCYLIIKRFIYLFSGILLLWGAWNSIQKHIFWKPCQNWEKYTETDLYWLCVHCFGWELKHDSRLLTCFDAVSFIIPWKFLCFVVIFKIHVGGSSCFFCFFCFSKQWYVLYPHEGPWYELLVIPLRFELLCSIMIPISIKVSWW